MEKPIFFEKLSLHARRILRLSFDIAQENGSNSVEPRHLLLAILNEKNSLGNTLLEKFGIRPETIKEKPFKTAPNKKVTQQENIPLSKKTLDIIAHAFLLANQFSYPYVGSEHLVHSLLQSNDPDISIFFPNKKEKIPPSSKNGKFDFDPAELSKFGHLMELPNIGFALEGDSEKEGLPALERYGIPLGTDEFNLPFLSRSKEIESILRTLGRKTKSNPLLIGEPGVGKTTIVEAVAHRIIQGNAGPNFEGNRVILLDLAAIVAGTSFRGEFESRLKEVIHEAREHPEIILFLDEIHTLIGAGNTNGGLDAANILKPALSRGEIRCIGATTRSEYKRYIEKDPALERRFHVIAVSEPTPENSIQILEESREFYEKHHKIFISSEAVHTAVFLSVKHLPERFLPDKAFDVLDESASLLRRKTWKTKKTRDHTMLFSTHKKISLLKNQMIQEQKFDEAERLRIEEQSIQKKLQAISQKRAKDELAQKPTLSKDDIAETLALMTGTSVEKILKKSGNTHQIFQKLSETIKGQEEALKKISATIIRSQLGIGSKPRRPSASFLFLGPSGIGKTLTAKTIADTIFEKNSSFIRFDMSEFMERHHMAQLIGSPAGYIGYGEGGKLTEHIRHHPSSVVLFDEIEKAHPDVLNLLLQILEEGTLTDAEGKHAYFGESIVVLTSNIGTTCFSEEGPLGFGSEPSSSAFESRREKALEMIRQQFRPELLARLDHIVVFRPLELSALTEIATQELSHIKSDLKKKNILLRFPISVPLFLAKKSTLSKDGARSIRKNVEQFIIDPIVTTLSEETRDVREISFSPPLPDGNLSIKTRLSI